ncbi:response regulator transcription factor [Propionibacterium australiense]|uniref:CheY-like superfamily n=1 Tax=Propionibacterium australiense TaxID=119981 RepID=A0A383S3P8_9ACTN|nr:response regulator transcription factor [Propionibacterium australiense]RLP11918.1 response regulator [Propionibacterium australiense]RLP12556.1 response regulator [Propionibacterium australiense]SYZ32620.1 CheY-like superfamily [Propionibacterium australiense]VEH91629.1 Transcriptional regulatory protein uhpA [Propionibacterium australiense]
MNPSPIRVLIADDQGLVRGALATLLGLEPDIEVVAQVGTGSAALDAVRAHAIDVALLDIDMPDMDGLAAVATITELYPSCRSLIVTTFGRPGYLSRALEAGASGFLVKDTPPSELAEAIRRIARGLRVIDPTLAQESVLLGPNPLTEREKDVLRLAAEGADAQGIARELALGEGTVRNYLSGAIAKTHARNRTEAARTAERNGWL